MSKSPEKVKFFPILKWIFTQMRRYDRDYLPVVTLELIFAMGVTFFPILMYTPLIQSLVARDFANASYYALLMVGGQYVITMVRNILLGRADYGRSKAQRKMVNELKLKLLEIDYPATQDKDKMDRFNQAMSSLRYEIGGLGTAIRRVYSVLEDALRIVLAAGITLTMLLSAPVPESASLKEFPAPLAEPQWAILLTVAVIFFSLALQRWGQKRTETSRRKYLTEHAKYEQDLQYYMAAIGGNTKRYGLYQLYDMLPYLRRLFKREVKKGVGFFQASVNYGAVEGFYVGISSSLLLILTYFLIGVKALTGAIALTTVVTYAHSFNALIDGVRAIGEKWTLFQMSLPYFHDIIRFTEMKNELATGTIPVEKRRDHEVNLEFKDVSFKYPNSEKWALRHVNLSLDMNRKHAVVGPNGSGKTTMILLLCRLYDPTEGIITLNGVDIRKYDYDEYLSLFGTVFQDFSLFALPLGENVASNVEYDSEKAEHVLCQAGFEKALKGESMAEALAEPIADFKQSSEIYSGGEKQKIAIARAIYKPSSVVILDEPTAALDPKAEAEIYKHLNEMIQDKTTVFISHRMSSCRFCEDIIVFDEGEIVQRGTHEDLVNSDGLYQKMWQAQSAYYQ